MTPQNVAAGLTAAQLWPAVPDTLFGIPLGIGGRGYRGRGRRRAALRVADERGHELGSAERARLRPGRLGTERALTLACETLERYGFEPARAELTRVFLHNCPFQPLAARAPDLVCAVNQAFLAGFLRGLGASTATAALTRPPGACCVELLAAGIRLASRSARRETRAD